MERLLDTSTQHNGWEIAIRPANSTLRFVYLHSNSMAWVELAKILMYAICEFIKFPEVLASETIEVSSISENLLELDLVGGRCCLPMIFCALGYHSKPTSHL